MSTISSAVVGESTGQAYGFSGFEGQIPANFAAYQKEVQQTFFAFLTPLNISLLIILITFTYFRLTSSSNLSVDLPPHQPTTFRTFTPRTLLPFNGHPSKPHNPAGKVYLAVKGRVFDVTSGRNFYGPGGPYENFAGRDATRGLAMQSFDEDMLTKDLDGPLDDCKDLDNDAKDNLQGWEERFNEKYLIVGKLVAYDTTKSEF